MKTKLFLGLAAVALMTSCSNDETIDMIQPNAIGFENAFVNNSTRAADITSTDLDAFAVYGYVKDGSKVGTLFDNIEVSRQGTSAPYTWGYGGIPQYWVRGADHWFTGIAPAKNGGWTFASADQTAEAYKGDGTITFNNKTVNGEKDLIYASSGKISIATGASKADNVGLTFNHLLSRVKFTFANGESNPNITFEVTDVTIKQVHSSGKINKASTTPEWILDNDKFDLIFGGAYSVDDENNTITKIAKGKTLPTNHKYMIPVVLNGSDSYLVSFKAQMNTGDVVSSNKTFETTISTPLAIGCSYNFIASLTGETMDGLEIKFDVKEVIDWTPEKDQNIYPPVTPQP